MLPAKGARTSRRVTGERVEMIWEVRYDIHWASDFRGDATLLAALPTTEMKDPRGDLHKVILTDGGQKPVAVVRRIVMLDSTTANTICGPRQWYALSRHRDCSQRWSSRSSCHKLP